MRVTSHFCTHPYQWQLF